VLGERKGLPVGPAFLPALSLPKGPDFLTRASPERPTGMSAPPRAPTGAWRHRTSVPVIHAEMIAFDFSGWCHRAVKPAGGSGAALDKVQGHRGPDSGLRRGGRVVRAGGNQDGEKRGRAGGFPPILRPQSGVGYKRKGKPLEDTTGDLERVMLLRSFFGRSWVRFSLPIGYRLPHRIRRFLSSLLSSPGGSS